MRLTNFVWTLVVSSVILLAVACNGDYATRAAGTIKPIRDTRTGLCFMYTSECGGSRYGLSQVDCALVQHALQQNEPAGRVVIDQLHYGYVQGGPSTVCLVYATDDGGNLRSNLAVVPCEPVQQAHQQSNLPLPRFRPRGTCF